MVGKSSRRGFLRSLGSIGGRILSPRSNPLKPEVIRPVESTEKFGRREFGKRAAAVTAAAVLASRTRAAEAQSMKKFKSYKDPKKATVTFDQKKDRAISEKLIIWDMRGFNGPALKDEPNIAKDIIKIGKEYNIDPLFITAHFRLIAMYGKDNVCRETRSLWKIIAPPDTPEGKLYIAPDGKKYLRFDSWAEGIEYGAKFWSEKSSEISSLFVPEMAETVCILISKMQYIDQNQGYQGRWDFIWKKVDSLKK